MENREIGIYIHIPFCKQKCYYCDFISFSNKKDFIEKYIEAIKSEIEKYFEKEDFFKKYNVTTIYIGGGTPSYIDSRYIVSLMYLLKEKLKNNKTIWENIEITIEMNPGTATIEKLRNYKDLGINRLSIGLQTTNNILLKEIGRIHTFEQFLQTYKLARQIGFNNINIDLMIGLPSQRIEDIKNSLSEVIKLNPEHISVYSLIIEEGTVIEKLIQNKMLEEMDQELERNMYWYVKNTLELNGYEHYEISNFAEKGKESKHNINCWLQKEYIGIGVAAHSYLNNIRYSNCVDIEKYINNIYEQSNTDIWDFIIKNDNRNFLINDNLQVVESIYQVNEIQRLEDQKKEYMLLGLRKIKGVEISKFKERYIDNPIFLYKNELDKLSKENLIQIDGNYIKLTNRGLDFANLVWEEFV